MTYVEFCMKSLQYYVDNKGTQRFGQAIFNYLESVRPDIANKLRGSDIDCFYKDSVKDEVWSFIKLQWKVEYV